MSFDNYSNYREYDNYPEDDEMMAERDLENEIEAREEVTMSTEERYQWLKYFELKEKGLEKASDIVLDGIIAKWYPQEKYAAESLTNLAQSL